jgi:hypothetical protein
LKEKKKENTATGFLQPEANKFQITKLLQKHRWQTLNASQHLRTQHQGENKSPLPRIFFLLRKK